MKQEILEKELAKEKPKMSNEWMYKLDKYYSLLPLGWFFDKNNLAQYERYLEKRKEYNSAHEEIFFSAFE